MSEPCQSSHQDWKLSEASLSWQLPFKNPWKCLHGVVIKSGFAEPAAYCGGGDWDWRWGPLVHHLSMSVQGLLLQIRGHGCIRSILHCNLHAPRLASSEQRTDPSLASRLKSFGKETKIPAHQKFCLQWPPADGWGLFRVKHLHLSTSTSKMDIYRWKTICKLGRVRKPHGSMRKKLHEFVSPQSSSAHRSPRLPFTPTKFWNLWGNFSYLSRVPVLHL